MWFFRHQTFIKLVWGFMGLYLLNISVDTADPNPNHVPEDLSINDQESIVELVVEKVFGMEDAIPEYDDHDTENLIKKTSIKVDLNSSHSHEKEGFNHYYLVTKTKWGNYNISQTSKGFTQTDTPPPQV